MSENSSPQDETDRWLQTLSGNNDGAEPDSTDTRVRQIIQTKQLRSEEAIDELQLQRGRRRLKDAIAHESSASPIRRVPWLSLAASALLLLGAGSFWLLNPTDEAIVDRSPKSSNIQPPSQDYAATINLDVDDVEATMRELRTSFDAAQITFESAPDNEGGFIVTLEATDDQQAQSVGKILQEFGVSPMFTPGRYKLTIR